MTTVISGTAVAPSKGTPQYLGGLPESVNNPRVTPKVDRPRWWFALRGFAFFLVGGGLGTLAYATVSHRPGVVPWVGLLLGALVCATLSAVFRGRRRH